MLTLASNERIPLTPTMRLIFEIGDLKTATPATVSRAGILFLNYTDVGWNPYVFSFYCLSYVMLCAIWYHLYNLKNVKNTHGEVLLLVKLQFLLKVTFLRGYFSHFSNCTNGTKSRNTSLILMKYCIEYNYHCTKSLEQKVSTYSLPGFKFE